MSYSWRNITRKWSNYASIHPSKIHRLDSLYIQKLGIDSIVFPKVGSKEGSQKQHVLSSNEFWKLWKLHSLLLWSLCISAYQGSEKSCSKENNLVTFVEVSVSSFIELDNSCCVLVVLMVAMQYHSSETNSEIVGPSLERWPSHFLASGPWASNPASLSLTGGKWRLISTSISDPISCF